MILTGDQLREHHLIPVAQDGERFWNVYEVDTETKRMTRHARLILDHPTPSAFVAELKSRCPKEQFRGLTGLRPVSAEVQALIRQWEDEHSPVISSYAFLKYLDDVVNG